eukprot:g3314.t1
MVIENALGRQVYLEQYQNATLFVKALVESKFARTPIAFLCFIVGSSVEPNLGRGLKHSLMLLTTFEVTVLMTIVYVIASATVDFDIENPPSWDIYAAIPVLFVVTAFFSFLNRSDDVAKRISLYFLVTTVLAPLIGSNYTEKGLGKSQMHVYIPLYFFVLGAFGYCLSLVSVCLPLIFFTKPFRFRTASAALRYRYKRFYQLFTHVARNLGKTYDLTTEHTSTLFHKRGNFNFHLEYGELFKSTIRSKKEDHIRDSNGNGSTEAERQEEGERKERSWIEVTERASVLSLSESRISLRYVDEEMKAIPQLIKDSFFELSSLEPRHIIMFWSILRVYYILKHKHRLMKSLLEHTIGMDDEIKAKSAPAIRRLTDVHYGTVVRTRKAFSLLMEATFLHPFFGLSSYRKREHFLKQMKMMIQKFGNILLTGLASFNNKNRKEVINGDNEEDKSDAGFERRKEGGESEDNVGGEKKKDIDENINNDRTKVERLIKNVEKKEIKQSLESKAHEQLAICTHALLGNDFNLQGALLRALVDMYSILIQQCGHPSKDPVIQKNEICALTLFAGKFWNNEKGFDLSAVDSTDLWRFLFPDQNSWKILKFFVRSGGKIMREEEKEVKKAESAVMNHFSMRVGNRHLLNNSLPFLQDNAKNMLMKSSTTDVLPIVDFQRVLPSLEDSIQKKTFVHSYRHSSEDVLGEMLDHERSSVKQIHDLKLRILTSLRLSLSVCLAALYAYFTSKPNQKTNEFPAIVIVLVAGSDRGSSDAEQAVLRASGIVLATVYSRIITEILEYEPSTIFIAFTVVLAQFMGSLIQFNSDLAPLGRTFGYTVALLLLGPGTAIIDLQSTFQNLRDLVKEDAEDNLMPRSWETFSTEFGISGKYFGYQVRPRQLWIFTTQLACIGSLKFTANVFRPPPSERNLKLRYAAQLEATHLIISLQNTLWSFAKMSWLRTHPKGVLNFYSFKDKNTIKIHARSSFKNLRFGHSLSSRGQTITKNSQESENRVTRCLATYTNDTDVLFEVLDQCFMYVADVFSTFRKEHYGKSVHSARRTIEYIDKALVVISTILRQEESKNLSYGSVFVISTLKDLQFVADEFMKWSTYCLEYDLDINHLAKDRKMKRT